jgi:hypothetical protein
MKPDFYFGHEQKLGRLVSQIKVEELLDADHDIYCILAMIDSEDDLYWYWFDPDHNFTGSDKDYQELDRNRAAYAIKTLYKKLKLEPYHAGSCCGNTDACTRCLVEDAYLKSLELVKKSGALYKGNMPELLAIIMAYEEQYRTRNKYAELYCKSRIEKNPTENVYSTIFKLFPIPSGDMESRLDYWSHINPIHQNYYRNRIALFRIYFDHPELVEHINFV